MNDNSKQKLSAAFKALRKAGFIAKQSFSCCGSCAGYDIATQVKEMTPAKQAKVKGTVFYTRQDAANLRGDERRWPYRGGSSKLFLAYGPVSVHEVGEFGMPTEAAGQAVVEALKASGLEVEWSGSPDEKIVVVLP